MGDDSYNPWDDLARRPEITLERRVFAAGDRTVGYFEPGRIVLNHLQRRTQARCTLSHELAHVDLEHILIDPTGMIGGRYLQTRQEIEADRLAASRLITIDRLADAIVWARGDWYQLADACNVTLAMVRVRWTMMLRDRAELAIVRHRFACCEQAA